MVTVESEPSYLTRVASLVYVFSSKPKSPSINTNAEALKEKLSGLLSNASIFGVDLIEAGLADAVCENLSRLIAGKGAVRETLKAL